MFPFFYITRWREDMGFMFEWRLVQYLTRASREKRRLVENGLQRDQRKDKRRCDGLAVNIPEAIVHVYTRNVATSLLLVLLFIIFAFVLIPVDKLLFVSRSIIIQHYLFYLSRLTNNLACFLANFPTSSYFKTCLVLVWIHYMYSNSCRQTEIRLGLVLGLGLG